MTNIITEIGKYFSPEVKAVETAFDNLKAAAVATFKKEEVIAVAVIEAAVGKVTPILTGIPSQQAVILTGLIETASKDAAAGDYTKIATDVMAQATTAETSFIIGLGIEFVAAWAAIWSFNPASVGA